MRKVFFIHLHEALFEMYLKGTLDPLYKDYLDNLVDRMRLIGHEAFVMPEGMTVTDLSGSECDTSIPEANSMPFFVFNIPTGNMPPIKAKAYVESIKKEYGGHPAVKNSMWFMKMHDSEGASVQMFYI